MKLKKTNARNRDQGGIMDRDLAEDFGIRNDSEDAKEEVQDASEKTDDDLFQEDLAFEGDFGGGGVSPMEKHADLLKSLTDFEPFMKTIVSEWLGMVWSESQEKYVEDPNVEPTMNLYGARWCINFLRVYTRDNNIITNLDKDTYADIMSDVIETVFLNIGCRAEEFEIKNDGDILKVSNQLCHATALVLVGTGGTNNYKDLLSKSVNRNENVQFIEPGRGVPMLQQQKRGGFLHSVGNWITGK